MIKATLIYNDNNKYHKNYYIDLANQQIKDTMARLVEEAIEGYKLSISECELLHNCCNFKTQTDAYFLIRFVRMDGCSNVRFVKGLPISKENCITLQFGNTYPYYVHESYHYHSIELSESDIKRAMALFARMYVKAPNEIYKLVELWGRKKL